jgi:hypothetical protein
VKRRIPTLFGELLKWAALVVRHGYLFLGGVSDRDLDISTRGGARLAPFFRPVGVVGRGMRSEILGPDFASMESHICLGKKEHKNYVRDIIN